MSNTDQNANDLKEWGQMSTAIAANAPDLPQTDIPRAALDKLTEELRKLVGEQKLHQSAKQQISQRMKEIQRVGTTTLLGPQASRRHTYSAFLFLTTLRSGLGRRHFTYSISCQKPHENG